MLIYNLLSLQIPVQSKILQKVEQLLVSIRKHRVVGKLV